MPESEKPIKTEEEKWITIGGKKINVKPGEDVEDRIREALPSARGEKEKNTKQALSKQYIQRKDLPSSIFKIRDEVVFDEYRKSGQLAGVDGTYLKILYDGYITNIRKDTVFKKSELIPDQHWDTMTKSDKVIVLKNAGIDSSYSDRSWMGLDPHLRNVILKTNSPAGYESTSQGNNNSIYNPISEEKTVSQRIKEEESKQHEEDADEKKSVD